MSDVPGAVLGALGLKGSALLTDAERREIAELDAARSRELIAGALLQEASTESVNPTRASSTSLGPEARWQRASDDALAEGDPVLPSSALDELMTLRGADLLLSTARQILIYRALGWSLPAWAHAPLVVGGDGRRLAKRSAALTIRELRGGELRFDGYHRPEHPSNRES